jgi:hypothetical protein
MEHTFCRLQQAFATAPALVHFDTHKTILLETHSSSFAFAGILSQLVVKALPWLSEMALAPDKKVAQDCHPVPFWSCMMAPAERNYTVRDQEMLAIVMSCRHWRHNLEVDWYPVVVLTDHHNHQRFMSTKPLTLRPARWWDSLQLLARHTI